MITFCDNKPYRQLLRAQSRGDGRNSRGVITVRHRGGSHKQQYRQIEFSRAQSEVQGTVERIEYDPNRSAHIALVILRTGQREYIIAPDGVAPGAKISSSLTSQITAHIGNNLPLGLIPIGTRVHCLEILPLNGAKLVRAAGTSAILVSNQGTFSKVRLQSGEVRLIHKSCTATVGEVSNRQHNLNNCTKAGQKRWKGIRPTVRGVAMNPIDHPHGGGEGKTASGRNPVSPGGIPTKGFRTRRVRRSTKMIVMRRT